MPEFTPFPKVFRFFRPVLVTEKLDGTNAAVVVSEDAPHDLGADEVRGPGIVVNASTEDDGWWPLYVYAQSRKRVISPEDDNFGFARWVREHAEELAKGLGPGVHFGEWWGSGIQRGYGLDEKRFSLFNVSRWTDDYVRPSCCHVVPTLVEIEYADAGAIRSALRFLTEKGSLAAPGFMNPEGIVIYHAQANQLFKVTIKGDDHGKSYGALA